MERPMVFPRNALDSGLQACFYPGKRIEKVKVGQAPEQTKQAPKASPKYRLTEFEHLW